MAKRTLETSSVEKKEVKKPATETKEIVEAIGTVKGCYKLNVRKKPNIDADIACTIDANSKVTINVTKSSKDWYKVETEGGINGYCMKQFIAVD